MNYLILCLFIANVNIIVFSAEARFDLHRPKRKLNEMERAPSKIPFYDRDALPKVKERKESLFDSFLPIVQEFFDKNLELREIYSGLNTFNQGKLSFLDSSKRTPDVSRIRLFKSANFKNPSDDDVFFERGGLDYIQMMLKKAYISREDIKSREMNVLSFKHSSIWVFKIEFAFPYHVILYQDEHDINCFTVLEMFNFADRLEKNRYLEVIFRWKSAFAHMAWSDDIRLKSLSKPLQMFLSLLKEFFSSDFLLCCHRISKSLKPSTEGQIAIPVPCST